MTSATVLVGLIAVTACAAVVQGLAGFGFGLVAATGYMWLMGPAEAVPLVMLVNFSMSGFLAVRSWPEVDRDLAPGLAIGCAFGLPCGVLVAASVDVGALLVTIGVVLVGFAAFLAVQDRRAAGTPDGLPSRRWSWPAGFLGGGLTTAIGMPGPPVVALLTLRRAGREALRSTSLGFFGLAYLAGFFVHAVLVGVGRSVWIHGAVLTPVAFVAGLVGARAAGRVGEGAFRNGVLALLAVVGLAAIARGVIGG